MNNITKHQQYVLKKLFITSEMKVILNEDRDVVISINDNKLFINIIIHEEDDFSVSKINKYESYGSLQSYETNETNFKEINHILFKMTKKGITIAKIYGDNFHKYDVDENGYSYEDNREYHPNIEWHPNKVYYWRPKGLEGIDDNNGWKPFDINKTPTTGLYWVMDKDGEIFSHNIDEAIDKLDWSEITDYQLVDKPKGKVY